MQKIEKKSLPKQVASQIEKKIKNGEFQIGEKIPSELELVKLLGVSRNSIREAIQSLILVGILESKQGKGTYVLANERFEADITTRLNIAQKNDILEVRRLVEVEIVKLAVQRRDEKDLYSIKKALEARNRSIDDIKENTVVDLNFHIAIAKASKNEIFYDLYKYVSQFIIKNIFNQYSLDNTKSEIIDLLHNRLYESILNQDLQQAENTINEILKI